MAKISNGYTNSSLRPNKFVLMHPLLALNNGTTTLVDGALHIKIHTNKALCRHKIRIKTRKLKIDGGNVAKICPNPVNTGMLVSKAVYKTGLVLKGNEVAKFQMRKYSRISISILDKSNSRCHRR